MSYFSRYIGSLIDLELGEEMKHTGILVDAGSDIVVVYSGHSYVYIPLTHVRHIEPKISDSSSLSNSFKPPSDENPILNEKELSYRKMLLHSKGMFVEIFVTGNQSIHGYVTTILTNYFVFYSPVYKTMYIPLLHLKWLIPYPPDQTPYTLERKMLPVAPSGITLARTFEEQLKKLTGKIVVFDTGLQADKTGLLLNSEDHIAELVTAHGRKLHMNVQQIKTVHFPDL
ncbi:DUF2642 domain-containing protein [Paenibacillus allorhizosphaerae]|uniref:DUF2642 domain-containing protein n=1 Tax=Paenibacillus allorhizosphaerae TaxID=2849866 RepID=A0ABN7THX9_9BACL|nr:DUF2642 domain-containing protein [Paenibacillus allorhizosphaerae]CAG7630476.1 hypothetical protein PAECIP111802_01640 [Paenibacillus allorhizosphaerae]